MRRNTAKSWAQQRVLVDAAIDAYVAWREACASVADAYANWAPASGRESLLAFGVYLAALDREEAAAKNYGGCIADVSRLLEAAEWGEITDALQRSAAWSA